MTSHDLLRKWSRERDELAFRELVHRHAPMVFATSRRILRDDTEAEDVTQECFETLATTRRLPTSNLGPWLHRVATNRSLDRLRTTGRRAKREIDFAARQFQPHATDWNDIYNFVDEAIVELPDKYRAVIIPHFLEGRTQADIANELNLTRQAVHERLSRGIESIRTYLKRRGIELSATTLTALLAQHASATTIPLALTASLGKLALAGHAWAASGILASFGLGKLALATLAIASVIAAGWFASGSLSKNVDSEIATASTTPNSNAAISNESQQAASATVESPTAAQRPASMWPNGPSTLPPPAVIQSKLKNPLEDGASVSGIVLRADGKIFPHAQVVLFPADGSNGGGRTEAEANGGFAMKGLGAGEYSILVTPPGMEMVSGRAEVAKLTLEPNEQRTDYRIYVGKGTLTIEGVVTDTAGKAVQGIRVETSGQYSAYSVAETDIHGRYTLEGLPTGKYIIEAEGDMNEFSESAAFARNTIHADAGDTTANIVLERRINLEGRVLRADTRAPVQNYRVSFMNGHAQEFHEFLMRNDKEVTDAQGRFRLEGAMPGHVTVSAMADGFSPAFVHAQGSDGATISGLEILLSPGHTVTGIVVDTNGQPIAGATIYNDEVTSPVVLEGAPIAAHTDATGMFSIADAPPTRSFLSAYRDGFAPAAARIGAGDIKIILQRPATLKIIATAPEGMLTGAHVMIFYGRHANADYVDGAQFDADGVAVKAGLIPGLVRVRIHRWNDTDQGYIERDIILNAGAETEVHVDFAPIAASLSGSVMWRGAPIHATVNLQIQTSNGLELYNCATENGSYSFTDLPAGDASVRVDVFETVESPGKKNIVNNIYLEPGKLTTYNISLLGACAITGRVNGIPAQNMVSIRIVEGTHTFEDLTDGSNVGLSGSFGLVGGGGCDENGNYSIPDLEPGEYTVVAEFAPIGDWSAVRPFAVNHVRVKAYETAVADFAYH